MRVTVNGEQREITSASVDALLGELEYEGTHFAIARELRRAAEKPLGRDGAEERRRDRDHHAAAGRVMMGARTLPPSSLLTQGPRSAVVLTDRGLPLCPREITRHASLRSQGRRV